MIPVTLIRISNGDADTYWAAASAETVNIVARVHQAIETGHAPPGDGPYDADTMPWTAIPGIRQLAEQQMNQIGPKGLLHIGTAVGGQWTSWKPPIPPPPPPQGRTT